MTVKRIKDKLPNKKVYILYRIRYKSSDGYWNTYLIPKIRKNGTYRHCWKETSILIGINSTITGNFIKTWNTAKQASIELFINEESIGQCARGKSKTAGGYVWQYTKVDTITPIKYLTKTNNKIIHSLK